MDGRARDSDIDTEKLEKVIQRRDRESHCSILVSEGPSFHDGWLDDELSMDRVA